MEEEKNGKERVVIYKNFFSKKTKGAKMFLANLNQTKDKIAEEKASLLVNYSKEKRKKVFKGNQKPFEWVLILVSSKNFKERSHPFETSLKRKVVIVDSHFIQIMGNLRWKIKIFLNSSFPLLFIRL